MNNTYKQQIFRKRLVDFGYQYALTQREVEIIKFIFIDGYSNREIAEVCSITHKTVRNHIANIMEKTSVSSSRQLSALFIIFMMKQNVDDEVSFEKR